MKVLAKNLEILLLNNNLVMVPGLGGFLVDNKQAEFDTFADESTAASRDAESERNGVDINQNVIVGVKEGIDSATQLQTEDPTATRPVNQPVSAPSEGPAAEREIDNASINKIFADEKAPVAAPAPQPEPVAPVPVPAPEPQPAPAVAPVAPAPAPATKFCRFCGKQIAADSAFCNYCGKDIR